MHALPELAALDSGRNVIRIPAETDIPVTARIKRLIETPAFRRLQRISQLGLVSQVYPGATHTRFEHSLGVYRLALLYLKSLLQDSRFAEEVDEPSLKLFLVSALMHDVGHWPFCHAIEDMQLPSVPKHEVLAGQMLESREVAACLAEDWDLTPAQVADFLSNQATGGASRLLSNMLSGPIDIDKLDYLDRDSLHAGVPYGRNFDRQRLINALCVGPTGGELAITEKGKTAAEMMVFARYVMFSEVYWHHAVRSATAMLQRAIFELPNQSILREWMSLHDVDFIDALQLALKDHPSSALVEGLFGSRRALYKRVAQYHIHEEPALHAALSRRKFGELVECSTQLAQSLSRRLGKEIAPHRLLIDAPPLKLEVQFRVQVKFGDQSYRPMGQVSPVVQALAERQFDDIVKRVRVFVAPEWRSDVAALPVTEMLKELVI